MGCRLKTMDNPGKYGLRNDDSVSKVLKITTFMLSLFFFVSSRALRNIQSTLVRQECKKTRSHDFVARAA